MTFSKRIRFIIPHLLGWGSFFLVILLQNDLSEWDFEDYYVTGGFFGIAGTAVYINLYLLIPRYLFTKSHLYYSGFVVVLIIVAAILITLWMREFDELNSISRFVVAIINVAFLLLLTSGAKLLIEYLQKMSKLAEIENKQLKDELSLLKMQVHPHFLFNTLNNHYGLITQNQNKEASEVTLKLADLMRYLLESTRTDKVSLHKEIQFLRDYLDLEIVRLSKEADIRFEISSIDQEIFIAPLLFISLVENTFKHGLQTISDKSFAHFSLAVQGNDLFFEAINSVGQATDYTSKSGTGLGNLQKRLQLIYPDKHQLIIEEVEASFRVTLHIQL